MTNSDFPRKFKKILVTGGAGYVGSALVPKLLLQGYHAVVYDSMYFGSGEFVDHPHLDVVKADIRDIRAWQMALDGADAVIHLACISNDPSFELDPDLGKSINYDCFEPLVVAARDAGVRRFIYASSSSVYGISEAAEVTEEHPLKPLTDYSRYKALCEDVLLRYQSSTFVPLILRPATVCGYAPRMRFDLTVNILTNYAVNKGKIRVFGGSQKRPNIHMDDIIELYVRTLEYPDEWIAGKIFNAGYQNYTVSDLAQMIKRTVEKEYPENSPIKIETTSSDDLRSYHVSSKKIERELGFVPRRTIEDAVRDICAAFKAGKLTESFTNDRYFNVQVMKGVSVG